MKKVRQYWLMKSEPETYGIDHLQKDGKTPWEGVRNFQARNYMRNEMQEGDVVLFYHSSCAIPGIYGLGKVASNAYPDKSQFNARGHYFEPRATKEKPIWFLVDIAFLKKFKEGIPLPAIRANKKLKGMKMLQPGSRLSVTPVTAQEFTEIERITQ